MSSSFERDNDVMNIFLHVIFKAAFSTHQQKYCVYGKVPKCQSSPKSLYNDDKISIGTVEETSGTASLGN
jgi:hypothetical protein